MAASYSKKRARIRGVSQVKRVIPVRTMEYGQRKPKTQLFGVTDEDVSDFLNARSTTGAVSNTLSGSHADDLQASIDVHLTDRTSESTNTESVYTKYRGKRNTKWTEILPLMSQAMIEEKAPAIIICSICSDTSCDTVFRCLDCGPMTFFCEDCCIQHHKCIVLHQPEEWNDGQFVPFILPLSKWERVNHDCGTEDTRLMLLLDHKGRPHYQYIQFCQCEDKAVTLTRFGFWPATPLKPTIAISIQLMTSLRSLVFAGQVSLLAFTSALQHQFETQYSQHPNVVKVFTWDMVLNFNVVYHEVTSLERVCPDLVQAQHCPACPKDKKIISMDGNFSMVRRRRAGTSLEPCERHPERFFFPQEEVDNFVANYSEVPSRKQECSNFQAGSVVRSKNKTEKLEVKGIFGSVCRHNYPFRFFDLKHGERMGYPVYLFNQIKDQTKLLLYDIACQMESHLRKRIDVPEDIVFGVPIFHVYGHKMHCQVNYNPRRIEGAGMSDGEGTERLWSYLGDFATITKEMTAENRRDLITELLLHYSMKLTNQMVKALCLKMEKASLTAKLTGAELDAMVATFPGGITRENMKEWGRLEKESTKKKKTTDPESWKYDYNLLLHEYDTKRLQFDTEEVDNDDYDDQAMELGRTEARLRRIEKKQGVNRSDVNSGEFQVNLNAACENQRKRCLMEVRDNVVQYTFHCHMRKKYANGQMQAKRLTTSLLSSSKNVDSSIKKFNQVPPFGNGPHRIARPDALKLDSTVYDQILDMFVPEVDPQIPAQIKRKAIDIQNLNIRAEEETDLLTEDMEQFRSSVLERGTVLQTKLDELYEKEYLVRYELGCICALKKSLSDLSKVQTQIEQSFDAIRSRHQLDIDAFIDHVDSLDSAPPEQLNNTEMKAILQEIASFEAEAEEDERLEEVNMCDDIV